MSIRSRHLSKNDLGFDSRTERNRKRSINSDGSFNIKRKNNFWTEFHVYQWVITCKWSTYWYTVLSIYVGANFLFASLYYLIGPENIVGIEGEGIMAYWQCFFFSLQSFTTVGYGGLHPKGMLCNVLAGYEAFLGLMTFALATGSLYGRFSRPEARLKYSPNVLISPFKEGKALMFMLCNNKKGTLVEASAKVNFSWVEKDENGIDTRRFANLELEIDKISMLPLSWTLVHHITENSVLYDFTSEDFIDKDVEIYILVSAYDDTFGQTVHSRSSYIGSEIISNAKFRRPFFTDANGNTYLDVLNLGAYDLLS